jgi:hypothetical protein
VVLVLTFGVVLLVTVALSWRRGRSPSAGITHLRNRRPAWAGHLRQMDVRRAIALSDQERIPLRRDDSRHRPHPSHARGGPGTPTAGWPRRGLLFGGVVYVIDIQIFARNVGYFSAFQATNQPLELAAHLVFGAVLAALLLLAKPRAAARTKP